MPIRVFVMAFRQAVAGGGRRESTQKRIQKMVDRIAERLYSEKTCLFGSHARGEAVPDNDVDLVVVVRSAKGRTNLGCSPEISVAEGDYCWYARGS